MYGLEYLRRKLKQKQSRVNLRYRYYEAKNVVKDLGISTPPQLRAWFNALGWCALAVDELGDRIVFDEFANDSFNITDIYKTSNQDILIPSAIDGALIGACSFIYISTDKDGYPRLQCINAYDATGVIDPFTYMLQEGYAVLEKTKTGTPVVEAYFTPESTEIYRDGKLEDVIDNPADYPLLVPIIYRPSAKRPFGHSRISRTSMSTVDSAIRTIKRSEIAAEFFSFPQRYITGLDRDAQKMDKWKAAMSTLLTFTKDREGKSPTLGQFAQQSFEPHMAQLRMFASVFAGETGLTLDDLGFVTDNPSSVDAIKAAHERLRRMASAAQKDFAVGFKNAGFLAACVRDDYAYERYLITDTDVKWAPLYEPDSAMLTGLGDGINKINQAVPGYFGANNISDLIGVKPETTSAVDLTILEDK